MEAVAAFGTLSVSSPRSFLAVGFPLQSLTRNAVLSLWLISAGTLFPSEASCQTTIPVLTSNTTDDQRTASELLDRFQSKFETFLAYSKQCYWPTIRQYTIIGEKRGKCTLITWAVLYTDGSKEKIVSTSTKMSTLSAQKLNELIANWQVNDFWNIDQDSLNVSYQQVNDTITRYFKTTDGCTDVFELFQQGTYRLLQSYDADYFQDNVPLDNRRRFILGRNAFQKIMISED